MTKLSIYFTLLFLYFPVLLFSQGETSNWYFGEGAGLHFNNDGNVTSLTDGQLNTIEGCTTISDNFGDLLFYTDGLTVYDRNHNVMINGNGLYGDPSSTQSALIVPKPEDTNIYYIFTVGTFANENRINNGLNYSIVDISLNNGNGAITDKNIQLLEVTSEKITAVLKDCSNQSIWLLTLASENGKLSSNESDFFNTYHAFEINENGIVTTSVKSTFLNLNIKDPRGYLKLSSDGTKLASANATDGLYIYDFNPDLGIVANQQKVAISGNNNSPYGIEFSQNSQYLYVHAHNNLLANELSGHSSSLFQYDLLTTNITNSEEILDTRPIYRGALQMGRNGKIYRTISSNYIQGSPFLGVINNPEKKGVAANYEHNAISLNGKNATQGLPPFIQSFFNKIDLVKNNDGSSSNSLEICEGKEFILEAENIIGATYSWSIDDIPITNPDNYFLKITKSEVIDTGRYRLEILLPDPKQCPIIGESTVRVLPLPLAPNKTLTQCDIDSNPTDGITSFNLEQINNDINLNYIYYTSSADRDSDNPITNILDYKNTIAVSQVIFYKAINKVGCENSGELTLEVKPVDLTINRQYLYSCDENPNDAFLTSTFNIEDIKQKTYPNAILYKTIEDATLESNPLLNSITTETTILYARLENANQCETIFEINLIITPTPYVDSLKPTYFVCTDNPKLNINAPDGFDSYKWSKIDGNTEQEISTNQIINIEDIGFYSLEVAYIHTENGEIITCENNVNFEVQPSNKAIIKNIDIKDISDHNTVEIFVDGDGDYEYSMDGISYQNNSFFKDVSPGFVTVYVRDTKNNCGISEEIISVIGYPKFFSPNGDKINDSWQIIGVNSMFHANSSISIFNRYGNLMAKITPRSSGWDGTIDGQPLPSSDYWFRVNLEDGREFKGHFSLKR